MFVERADGTFATSDDFTAITTTVTNLTTAATDEAVDVDPTEAVTVLVSADPRFTPTNDAPGYNVAVDVAGDRLADDDAEYQIDTTFTPVTGLPFTVSRRFQTEANYAE